MEAKEAKRLADSVASLNIAVKAMSVSIKSMPNADVFHERLSEFFEGIAAELRTDNTDGEATENIIHDAALLLGLSTKVQRRKSQPKLH